MNSVAWLEHVEWIRNVFRCRATQGAERGVALLAELTVGLIFGALAGLCSSILITVRGNSAEVGNQLQGLNGWLRAKHVPPEQRAPIMEYFHSLWHAQNRVEPAQLLAEMPPTMAGAMTNHLYARFLSMLPLFKGLSHEVINALCKAVVPILAVKDQLIMREGDTGLEMYMLMKGEVEVTHLGERLGFLAEGAFFGTQLKSPAGVPSGDASTYSFILCPTRPFFFTSTCDF
eukprot:SAG11_NODE_494_length_8948_cov_2.882699_6_plen_231_part_00